MTQGSRANTQGKILEGTIIPTFERYGFQIVKYSEWSNNPTAYGSKVLLKNVPYTTIYGHKGYTEFLAISDQPALQVRIECKWQQSPGSVDEKFPYLYLNCLEAIPEKDRIIIAGGGGMKKGTIPWLKRVVQEKRYLPIDSDTKNIQVFTIEEFIIWANINLF